MKHRLRNVLTVLSVLLGMAVSVLWVRSYFVVSWAAHYTPRSLKDVALSGGEVLISWDGGAGYGVPAGGKWDVGSRPRTDQAEDPKRERLPGALGFGFESYGPESTGGYYWRNLAVPLWLLQAAVASPALAAALRLARNSARRRAGRCRRCGYDLRATPQRCPECGTYDWRP